MRLAFSFFALSLVTAAAAAQVPAIERHTATPMERIPSPRPDRCRRPWRCRRVAHLRVGPDRVEVLMGRRGRGAREEERLLLEVRRRHATFVRVLDRGDVTWAYPGTPIATSLHFESLTAADFAGGPRPEVFVRWRTRTVPDGGSALHGLVCSVEDELPSCASSVPGRAADVDGRPTFPARGRIAYPHAAVDVTFR